jgi:multidrug efflux pump subunit AcrA (membrane-fusion protein)
VQEQDRTTRIQVTDTKGQELAPGAVVKIRIVLERKQNVLWLPPDAVRAFEGRRFVVVREGERERRVTVKIGIETEDRVEILEGVKAGDVIVGQ